MGGEGTGDGEVGGQEGEGWVAESSESVEGGFYVSVGGCLDMGKDLDEGDRLDLAMHVWMVLHFLVFWEV